MEWYNSLAEPSWTPAPATISPIWTILYPVILVSFGFVFVQAFRGKVGWKLALPFAVNLAATREVTVDSNMTQSLCETCRWMREVTTPKSRFLLCQLSQTNPAYPKYPPQPIVRCQGHEPKPEKEADKEK